VLRFFLYAKGEHADETISLHSSYSTSEEIFPANATIAFKKKSNAPIASKRIQWNHCEFNAA
jgi:hypothetical protein